MPLPPDPPLATVTLHMLLSLSLPVLPHSGPFRSLAWSSGRSRVQWQTGNTAVSDLQQHFQNGHYPKHCQGPFSESGTLCWTGLRVAQNLFLSKYSQFHVTWLLLKYVFRSKPPWNWYGVFLSSKLACLGEVPSILTKLSSHSRDATAIIACTHLGQGFHPCSWFPGALIIHSRNAWGNLCWHISKPDIIIYSICMC